MPIDECTLCTHGGTGLPPAQCEECGGVYGTSSHPARCRQCNQKVISLAVECQNWLDQNEPPAEPPE